MFKTSFVAAALFVALSSSSHAVTIFSDNFNGDTLALNGSLTNWTVSNGTIDVIGANPAPFFNLYPGNGNYVDMDGSSGNAGKITTIATFNLVAGQRYALSFDYGKNGAAKENLNFGVGSYLGFLGFNTGAIPALVNGYYEFIAGANQTGVRIFFEDLGKDNQGVIIDNVQLSSVPIPAAAPLLAMGLMGLGALARRRKAVSKI
jgi:Protein of unknown function (DUF642)